MTVDRWAQQAGFVAAGDGVGERPGSEEDAGTVQQLAHGLRPDAQGLGDLDLRMALGQEAERGQLVLGEQVFHVRTGRSMCRCSVSAPMPAAW
ncbi:hypothetical protein, partial [Streptomyces cyaneofuscatus]|uniref:hypothetical protein n=1 Tax=Streptomyces cyaneofuscatus TaxID=66883 RepID=UPI0036EC359C